LAVTAGDEGLARLWETATGKPFGPPLRHRGAVDAVAFSPDGSILLTGSGDGAGRLWDVKTGKLLGPTLRHREDVSHVAYAPNGKTVLTGSLDNTARLWILPTPWNGSPEQIARSLQAATGLELDGAGVLLALDPSTWRERRLRPAEDVAP
jgi:WD40 repeat protein